MNNNDEMTLSDYTQKVFFIGCTLKKRETGLTSGLSWQEREAT
jgi:hypothetical protein